METPIDLGRCELCLNVSDVARSRAFYEKLGFRPVGGDEAEGWRILTNGDQRLGLYQGHITEPMLNFRGGEVFPLARELQARGIELESGPEIEADQSAGAMLRDPDGFAIYLNTAPGESKSG